jgi:hypothetical protein
VKVAGRMLANMRLTVMACLLDVDEGPPAAFLCAACSAANRTSLEQLQQVIL